MPISLRPSGLAFRLVAFLLVGGLIPVLVLGWLASTYVESSLHEDLGLRLSVWLEAERNRVSQRLAQEFFRLRRLSRDPELRRGNPEPLREFFRERLGAVTVQGRSIYRCLSVFAPWGEQINGVGDCSHVVERRRAWSWGSRPSQWMSPTYFLSYDTPAVDLFFPFHEKDPYDNSGLWVTLDLGFLSTQLARAGFVGGVHHDLVVFDATGRMLGRRSPADGLLANTPAAYPVVLAAAESGSTFAVGEIVGGRQAIAAVLPLVPLAPELAAVGQWRMAVIQPLDDRSDTTLLLIERVKFGLALVVILTVLFSLTFAALLLRGILRPVHQLTEAVDRVRRGDLDTPVEVEGIDEFVQLGHFFDDMRRQLRRILAQLTELAVTDPLTGVPNRRSFDLHLEGELKRARRYGEHVSVAVLDLDHFKNINDTFGHTFGDLVLREVAQQCRRLCRETDLFARYGGEEFALVLPHTPKERGVALLERIRKTIEEMTVEDPTLGYSAKVTLSVGVACFPEDGEDPETLVAEADEALYRAKAGGRNRVAVA
ncbi:MAG: hypothetical protein Kow00109_27800 [Acidobacteriota bacterium]